MEVVRLRKARRWSPGILGSSCLGCGSEDARKLRPVVLGDRVVAICSSCTHLVRGGRVPHLERRESK